MFGTPTDYDLQTAIPIEQAPAEWLDSFLDDEDDWLEDDELEFIQDEENTGLIQ